MGNQMNNTCLTYDQRIDLLRTRKMEQTREKQMVIGAMDHDDFGSILPPEDQRSIIEVMGASGVPVKTWTLRAFQPTSNHPSGGFFGARNVGANFRALLSMHPVYVDPASSLAGAYMVSFFSYRGTHWKPEFDYSHLRKAQETYKIVTGIGGVQHFCQDLKIGLDLGWCGLLDKIRRHRQLNPKSDAGFYDGLEDVVLGIQDWIGRTADEASRMAAAEPESAVRENLQQVADINQRLVSEPPQTFREACQWILWFINIAQMYNQSGSLGKLDVLLCPYYERDIARGTLSPEEAVFHIACLLVRNTSYCQLGGPDASAKDETNPVSYLILEASHRLRVPANIGVCVGDTTDPGLLHRGVEILMKDRTGIPKFLGVDNTIQGFTRNGYPLELARTRAYSGCHWSALPGREYTMNDCVKINFAAVFDVALREMLADPSVPAGTEELWRRFERHMSMAVRTAGEGIDFHLAHMHEVFPELVIDLLCHGPIEKGRDASAGGVEYYNMCVDGAALATVADSFSALAQRVEREARISWTDLLAHLDADWAGPEGEQCRQIMQGVPRFGSGASDADRWAIRTAELFTRLVKERPTPAGHAMIPGIFSWASTILMGKDVGATPNGRRALAPISHGANPNPGFRRDGAPTALALAVASVQSGYGNASPAQIDLDAEDPETVEALIRTHFRLGGTQININVVDAEKILVAEKNPELYPDLVVRVTGFSAYFGSLSPQFRRLVVERVLARSGQNR
jgi:formate C-acetyltransferase